ncbi:MAG TPA: universal stress protein [Candidatus Binatia bacterium]|nr:universal stress protein [Candidatus Binatia bacterium]
MYKKILVPLDGSNLSDGVLPYVRWLARALKVSVELMYVNDPARLAPYSATIQGGKYLEKTAGSFSGAPVKCTVEEGNPAERIIHAASAEPGSLVTMATHGYSGAARWLLGSVAEKVLRALTSDLLLVRPHGANGNSAVELKSVLVPLDRSQAAEMVLPTVSELAQVLDLEILLVHVTKHVYTGPPDAFLPVFGAIPNLKELWEQDKAEANKYLTEKVDQLRAQGLANLSAKVIEGGVDGAAAEIIDAAQKISGSLIAMTRHGQTGIGRWLIGSITERVVCHSRTPVLVVRPRE